VVAVVVVQVKMEVMVVKPVVVWAMVGFEKFFILSDE